jgi:hypothetical protein
MAKKLYGVLWRLLGITSLNDPRYAVVVIIVLNTLHKFFIPNRQVDYVMDGKDEPTFHVPYHVTAITFLIIGIIAAGIFVCTLVLNQNHTALAQQQQPTLEGIFFQKERLFLLSVSLWFKGINVVYLFINHLINNLMIPTS